MLIKISLKESGAEIVGYITSKHDIIVAQEGGDKKKNFKGEKLWVTGYSVFAAGFEEAPLHFYLKCQEYIAEGWHQRIGSILTINLDLNSTSRSAAYSY
jgi:REP element-mobilizing transposase RayT